MRHLQEKSIESSQDVKTSLTMKTILLALLVATARGQSGFDDEGPRIACWSHISMTSNNSLTCRVSDEDEEDGTIEKMTACFRRVSVRDVACLCGGGATLTSPSLHPLAVFNVTVYLRNSAPISLTVDLKTIVKPRKPIVRNVTQNRDTNQLVILIKTLYQDDYLTVQNQFFQVLLWTAGSKMVLNLTSSDTLALDLDHLEDGAQYHAKARSIPQGNLQGTWSDWSDTYRFSTAARHSRSHPGPGPSGAGPWWPVLVSVVLSLTTVLAIFLFWRQKVYRLMWPQIPKPSLVDIRTSARGLLLHFAPENFSLLVLEKQHSAICSSGGGTEEQLHLSSGGFGVKDAEMPGTNSKEDAYVTMSSFYHVQ